MQDNELAQTKINPAILEDLHIKNSHEIAVKMLEAKIRDDADIINKDYKFKLAIIYSVVIISAFLILFFSYALYLNDSNLVGDIFKILVTAVLAYAGGYGHGHYRRIKSDNSDNNF